MRSHAFLCRSTAMLVPAVAPTVRPSVPVIPGRSDMPTRPPYVPVNAHYVNPNGRPSERRHVTLLVLALVVATILLGGAAVALTSWRSEHPGRAPEPGFTTMPTTYGPPRAGGERE